MAIPIEAAPIAAPVANQGGRGRRLLKYALLAAFLAAILLAVYHSADHFFRKTLPVRTVTSPAIAPVLVGPRGSIAAAIRMFQVDVGRRPLNLTELVFLLGTHPDRNRWRGPYLKDPEELIDPWGRAYRYDANASKKNYRLWSVGLNGIDESSDGDGNFGDDVRNWK
jgi:Type II secretion system (T2SS), protein G